MSVDPTGGSYSSWFKGYSDVPPPAQLQSLANAFDNLWMAFEMEGPGGKGNFTNLSNANLSTITGAINQIMAYYNQYGAPPAGSSYQDNAIYNLLTTPFSLPGGGSSDLANLAQNGGISQANLSAIAPQFVTLNGDLNTWYSQFYSPSYGPPPPTNRTADADLERDYGVLSNDLEVLEQDKNANPPASQAQINADLERVAQDVVNVRNDLTNPSITLDGYGSFLLNLLDAPLDAAGDSIASYAETVAGGSPPAQGDLNNLYNALASPCSVYGQNTNWLDALSLKGWIGNAMAYYENWSGYNPVDPTS